ncbi:hypothetical protein [Wolbachia endosymbiont (group A) of Agelastica alni]
MPLTTLYNATYSTFNTYASYRRRPSYRDLFAVSHPLTRDPANT